jgi:hypothetical protein
MSAASIITSIVTGGTNNHATVSEEANAIATDFVTQGVVGAITSTGGIAPTTGSFAANADGSLDMGVTISAGEAYVTVTPASQDSQTLRARMLSDYTNYAINSNSSGSTKYDYIYLKADAATAANPSAAADDVITLYTSRSTSNSADDGSPPTYGVMIAMVTVANGATFIANASITDKRTNASIGAQLGSLIVTQPSTGNPALVQAAGVDTNIDLNLNPKGTGNVQENGLNIDWWMELGRDTLSVAGDTLSVASFTPMKYLKILVYTSSTGGTTDLSMRFNNDSANHYSFRYSTDGATDVTLVSQSNITISGPISEIYLANAYISNVATDEKLADISRVRRGTAGAGNAPGRHKQVGKWSNIADQITRIDVINVGGTGNFSAGNELVVLGHN